MSTCSPSQCWRCCADSAVLVSVICETVICDMLTSTDRFPCSRAAAATVTVACRNRTETLIPKYARRQPSRARATSPASVRSPATTSAPVARNASARSSSRCTSARTGTSRRRSSSTTDLPTPPTLPAAPVTSTASRPSADVVIAPSSARRRAGGNTRRERPSPSRRASWDGAGAAAFRCHVSTGAAAWLAEDLAGERHRGSSWARRSPSSARDDEMAMVARSVHGLVKVLYSAHAWTCIMLHPRISGGCDGAYCH